VSPAVRLVRRVLPPTQPVASLNEATIAELWDYRFRGDLVFETIERALAGRYPGIKFIRFDKFGDIHGPHEREILEELPRLLAEHRCTAVISAVGG
jgi:hypothetical protein